jgi:hypothetical protein
VSCDGTHIYCVLNIIFALGISLLNKMREAIRMRAQQRQDFLAYEESLRSSGNNPTVEWRKEVQAWEADRSLPNPYVPRGVGESHICSY